MIVSVTPARRLRSKWAIRVSRLAGAACPARRRAAAAAAGDGDPHGPRAADGQDLHVRALDGQAALHAHHGKRPEDAVRHGRLRGAVVLGRCGAAVGAGAAGTSNAGPGTAAGAEEFGTGVREGVGGGVGVRVGAGVGVRVGDGVGVRVGAGVGTGVGAARTSPAGALSPWTKENVSSSRVAVSLVSRQLTRRRRNRYSA